MPVMQLYLKEDDRQKMHDLAVKLEAQGVDVRNLRHPDSISYSQLVRYLVEQKLKEVERPQ